MINSGVRTAIGEQSGKVRYFSPTGVQEEAAMSTAGRKMARNDLSDLLRREFANEAVKRQVARLPLFKMEQRLPSKLDDLMAQLDTAKPKPR
jgi:hypothetical protein